MYEIPNVLEPKEEVLWNSKPKYSAYMLSGIIGSIIAGGLVGVFCGMFSSSVVIGIIAGIVVLAVVLVIVNMAYNRTHYAITNKRVIFQSGIIGRDFKSIDYDRIQNASVNVGLIGVMFKVGNIHVFTGEMETVNTGKTSHMRPKYDSFQYVPEPYNVLKVLQQHLSRRKERLYGGKA